MYIHIQYQKENSSFESLYLWMIYEEYYFKVLHVYNCTYMYVAVKNAT